MARSAHYVAVVNHRGIRARSFLATARFLGLFTSVLEHIVRRNAVLGRARRQGWKVSGEELQDEADAFRRVLGLHSAADAERFLTNVGYSLEDFESEMEFRITCRKRAEGIEDAEIEAWFHEHLVDFERAKLSHVVVREEGLARELMIQVQEDGRDFAELASKHTIDEPTRDSGGLLGWMRRGDLESAVAGEVFAARPGDCAGPTRLGDGSWQLLFVHETRSAALDQKTRDEVRELLFNQWLTDLTSEARVELAPLA